MLPDPDSSPRKRFPWRKIGKVFRENPCLALLVLMRLRLQFGFLTMPARRKRAVIAMGFFRGLNPVASHVAVAVLAIAMWIFLIVPLWRRWRPRLLLLSENNLLKKRLAAATIVLLVFAVGLWAGWHKDAISARLSRRHSELTRSIPSPSPSAGAAYELADRRLKLGAPTPAAAPMPTVPDSSSREVSPSPYGTAAYSAKYATNPREHEIDQVPPLPASTASEVFSPATRAIPAEPCPSVETSVAQAGGRLIVLRAPNFGWNMALNLKIDGRTAANLVQGGRYDDLVPAGRHMLTVSAVPNYQPTSTVLNVQHGQTYVFTATRQNTDRVVLVP